MHFLKYATGAYHLNVCVKQTRLLITFHLGLIKMESLKELEKAINLRDGGCYGRLFDKGKTHEHLHPRITP